MIQQVRVEGKRVRKTISLRMKEGGALDCVGLAARIHQARHDGGNGRLAGATLHRETGTISRGRPLFG